MSRRRPTSADERNAARLRKVSTGRGQANAGPVRANPQRTRTVGPGGLDWAFVETYDEDVAFARPNVHITFDPDEEFPPAS